MPTQVVHLVEIYPPSNGRRTWLNKCSANDYSRSYRTRLEAAIDAHTHVLQVITFAELSKGYQFDDSPFTISSVTDRMQEILNQPLVIESDNE